MIRVLRENAGNARDLVRALAPAISGRGAPCAAGCHRALDSAVITPSETRDPELASCLEAVAGRVLGL